MVETNRTQNLDMGVVTVPSMEIPVQQLEISLDNYSKLPLLPEEPTLVFNTKKGEEMLGNFIKSISKNYRTSLNLSALESVFQQGMNYSWTDLENDDKQVLRALIAKKRATIYAKLATERRTQMSTEPEKAGAYFFALAADSYLQFGQKINGRSEENTVEMLRCLDAAGITLEQERIDQLFSM